MIDTYKEYKLYLDDIKSQWLLDNSSKTIMMTPWILPLRPDLGKYVIVNSIEIFEEIFPDEFNQISKAYFSALEKLEKHYKQLKTK